LLLFWRFLLSSGESLGGDAYEPFEVPTETRLSVVLEEVGGRCEPRIRENKPYAIAHTPRHMHFAPASHEAWGYSDDRKR